MMGTFDVIGSATKGVFGRSKYRKKQDQALKRKKKRTVKRKKRR